MIRNIVYVCILYIIACANSQQSCGVGPSCQNTGRCTQTQVDCSNNVCTTEYDPICACNSVGTQETFTNCCAMNLANCRGGGWTKLYDGECGSC